jgi:hypothetical protein
VCPRSTRTHHFSKAVALLVAGRVLVYAKSPMRLPTLDQYRNVGLWQGFPEPSWTGSLA